MGRAFLAVCISLTILLSGSPCWAQSSLEPRLNSWPDWSLPAPLPRPSNRDDLIYPDWFAGLWQVESIDLDAPDDPPLLHQARFQADRRGRLVGDRSFNATAIGRALLGNQLLGVEEDPDSANRQIARLKGDLYLETTVTGRRQESPTADTFLADELVLQILHTPERPDSAGSKPSAVTAAAARTSALSSGKGVMPLRAKACGIRPSPSTTTNCASHLFQGPLHQLEFELIAPLKQRLQAGVIAQTRNTLAGEG